MYRATGEEKYLELAQCFVDMRGSQPGGGDQNQALVPLREETRAVGHAVTAGYLYCGATDVVAETGDEELLAGWKRIWDNAVHSKMYITGGTSAQHHGASERPEFGGSAGDVHEAFGYEYSLPNATAYNETCANIAHAMWNWRMLNCPAMPNTRYRRTGALQLHAVVDESGWHHILLHQSAALVWR